MSNPGSPGGGMSSVGSVANQRGESNSDNGNINETEGTNSKNVSGNHLDPCVLLEPLEISDGQLQSLNSRKKASTAGILIKPGKSSSNVGSTGPGPDMQLNMERYDNPAGLSMAVDPPGEGTVIPTTPSIVKPRRLSVHFAVDSEQKVRAVIGGFSERSRQDGGGSRKHRSRKEKLVCRSESPSDLGMEGSESPSDLGMEGSESPSDLGMEGSESRKASGTVPVSSSLSMKSVMSTSSVAMNNPVPSVVSESTRKKRSDKSVTKKNYPVGAPPRKATQTSTCVKLKSRVKRPASGSTAPRTVTVGSRKIIPVSNKSGTGNLREPVVKKKKVIEIVSPTKRKMGHSELLKTSSDPIFVRAATQPFKFKTKSHHNRLKFSRVNSNKSSSTKHGSRQQTRRSTSLNPHQPSSGASSSKQRLFIGSPIKKKPEVEPPCFPPSLISDLLWVLEDADKEFSSEKNKSKNDTAAASSSHLAAPFAGYPNSSDPLPSGCSADNRFIFEGRRRVESEPPDAVGFEMPPTPGSPLGSQTFSHVRKEVYFSPSPSYSAPGPTGKRRYSRKRHAKIHPPFEDSNCMFQGHHCPNSKVPGSESQYCEKHLDQGPASSYSQCKHLNDGRQCGNLFPTVDSTMTYCELHAKQYAKTKCDRRDPKTPPNATKNLLTKIRKIFTEGLTKMEVGNLDTSCTSPDILHIIDEPEIIQDLPLGNFTGGLLEELDVEGERNVNPDKPDYDALKNAGYFTTEEIIQIHANKLRKLKTLYQREKELESLTRQHKLKFFKDGLDKLKKFRPRFTTNPYLISKNAAIPKEYMDHQLKQYDAAKAILQTAYRADGEKGLLRLKVIEKTQELARMTKSRGQKQHDNVDICDSDADSDCESRERRDPTRYTGNKSIKCAYNEGYAIRACQNPPVCWSNYCFKHILSEPKQVPWIACNRRIGPDPQDTCKTPCLRILEKHGCAIHAPIVLSKHKPLRRSEEELNLIADSDNEEEEEVTLESESQVLANLVSDQCLNVSHLDEVISQLGARGSLEITDESDSEETDDEEIGGVPLMRYDDDDDTATCSEEIRS